MSEVGISNMFVPNDHRYRLEHKIQHIQFLTHKFDKYNQSYIDDINLASKKYNPMVKNLLS